MDKSSTTAGNDPQTGDATADSTTAQDSTTATDQQTADKGDNLDPSKSPDQSSADGDKTPADDKKDGVDPPASTFDDDIDEWISKRGLPQPTNDAEKLAYQGQRNEQREFTRAQQARKDADALGATVEDIKKDVKPPVVDDDDLDPLEKRQNALEARYEQERTTRLQSEFYTTNKVTTEQNSQIMELIKEKVARPTSQEGKLAALNFWTSPDALPDLLDLANARLEKATDKSAVADEAALKERERIAQESQSNGTNRSARTTQTSDKSPDEQRKERLMGKYS